MIPSPAPPPDLSTFFNRFSKEELHQIGLALIQQSQHINQTQQQVHHPGLSQHSSRRLPGPTRPPLETFSSIPVSSSSFIPPLMNHQPHGSNVRPLMEQRGTPVTSTPRRPASDSFDNSGGNNHHISKRPRNNDHPPRNEQHEQQQLPTLAPPRQHHQHTFNINVLKRAVSNNLPCFFIVFSDSVEPNNIPSSIQVAIMLKKLLINNHLAIKELSMCVQAGERRFKFAVSDKADFLTLFNWKWPDAIEDKKVEFIKPHPLPNCFALVVRYIPPDVKQDTARQEILKTIPAAVGFSSIQYHHRQRPSYDLRFSVLDLEQYQTALELGRLAIGQYYLPLTTFLAGYRLTYCTACWKIGHMRDKCQSPVSCRKCLVPYINGVKHFCQDDTLKCAQCGGNHFSLDSICPVVRKYREELKGAVDNALVSGAIKRPPPPGETSRPFQQQANDFPVLNQAQVNRHSAWTTTNNDLLQSNLKKEVSELVVAIKTLTETMIRTEKNFNELNCRIDLQDKRNFLHSNSISAVIDTVQLMSKWVQSNNNERPKVKKNIKKSMEDLQEWKQQLDSNVNNNNNNESIASPPPPITISSTINNGEVDMNEDLSMNSIGLDA